NMACSRDRINVWLDSLIQQSFNGNWTTPDENQDIHRSDSKSEVSKRKHSNTPLLPSPPASLKRLAQRDHYIEMSQQQTPKKRRLNRDASTDDDATAQVETPRGNKPASVLGSDVPALPSRASSVISGQSSPSRQLNQLRLHPKGSDFRSMNINDEDMPLSLAEFVLQMQRVGKSRFVPAHLEAEVSQRKRNVRSLLEFDQDVYAASSTEAQSASLVDSCTLDDILQIVAKAKDAANLKQDEAGWNNLVHTPILEMVLYGRQGWGKQLVGFCPCITAGILPQYRVESISGKKVDFALLIDPQFDPESVTAVDALWQLRGTVNHTDFVPLQKRPVTVSIETKRTNESLERASLQMSVWHAAQWRFLEELAGSAALDELEFLPGVFVQGHKWEFVASSYLNGRTTLWTERTMGTTQSELGVFQVMAGLNRLRRWSLEVFWPWYKTYVLRIDVGAEQMNNEEAA
ncbi:hypothetical protein FOXB_16902, partial [Fusarium oxysporum f. sp. conglutinans Fo5176]